MTLIELLGKEEYGNQGRSHNMALYKCGVCGNGFKTVLNTRAKSCQPCANKTRNIKHNLTNTNRKMLNVWNSMMQRCNNKNSDAFVNYGGRGITVCERWANPLNFVDDMLPTYKEGLSIDRINNNGNYEPSNCRWATKKVQQRNRRAISKRNTSGFKGVSFSKVMNKWRARVNINKKEILLGYVNTPQEAAILYDNYIIQNNLEHTINGASL